MRGLAQQLSRHGLVPDSSRGGGKREARRDPRLSVGAVPGLAPSGPGAALSIPFPNRCNFQNLTGRRFGEWMVVDFAGSGRGRPMWKCRCSCGTVREVFAWRLSGGTSRSCGCVLGEHQRASKAAHAEHYKALSELAASAERYVLRCDTCGGSGELLEDYACLPVIDGTVVRSFCIGAARLHSPCPACGELRRAIARAQGIAP